MALLYPWATKEYILRRMSMGQLVMYYNEGMRMKYGDPKETDGSKKLGDMSHDELKTIRDGMRESGLLDAVPSREELVEKYGRIDDGTA